jgi:outer membrane protein assembly factor BamE (lipoprotein component of BamABCDE complex)
MKFGDHTRHGPLWPLRALLTLALVSLTLVATACTPIYTNHGYIPTDDDLALLQVGVDTRDTVAATVGRPAASGLLGDEAWYYVQSRFKTVGMAEKTEIDRQVVAISFDPDGSVANIERFGLDQGRIVPISRRVTTTNIRGKGVLAQIFGNIGRLNTGDLFK